MYEIDIPKNAIVKESLDTFPLLSILTFIILKIYLIIYKMLKINKKILIKSIEKIIVYITFVYLLLKV